MLNSLFGLQLGVDLSRSGSYNVSNHRQYSREHTLSRRIQGVPIIPAAVAGSEAGVFGVPALGLRASRLRGLRVRVASDCREEGERERRSNREGRRGSDSV